MRKDALAIFCRLINTCWFVFKWSIAAMLITVVVLGGYLYLRLDDEVRRYAEGVFATHYADLDVKLGSARFEAGRGVTLRNLTLGQRTADGALMPLAEVDEMQLLGKFDLETLGGGCPLVERIRIRGPRLYAARGAAGEWNLAELFPPPSTGERPATIDVEGAVIVIADRTTNKPLTLRDVNVSAECIELLPPTVEGESPQRTYRLRGSVGGDLAASITFGGTVSTGNGALDLSASCDQLDLSSAPLTTLLRLTPALARVAEVKGRADVTCRATSKGGKPLDWQANFRVVDGRVAMEGVSRTLQNVSVEGTASTGRLMLTSAKANFGKARLSLALDRWGWQAAAKMAMKLRVEDLTIDQALGELVPDTAQGAWQRFQPAGMVTADVGAQFDGERWKPAVKVSCQDVSFTDQEKFAYRLTGGSGTLAIVDHEDGRGPVLEIEQLTAMAEGTPVTINGSFAGLPGLGEKRALGGEPLPAVGWLEVSGQRLPIVPPLTSAIEPTEGKVQRIVDTLDAKGRVSLWWRFERTDPLAEPHTQTRLEFHDSRVQFDKFPYPLRHIEGLATERDGNWQFENLVSREANTPRQVYANGSCTKTHQGHQLQLSFVGQQVPLDDTLRLALLEPVHQEVWAAVRPRSGRINLTATVAHHIGVDTRPAVHLQITPVGETVSIEPSAFEYRLEKLAGNIEVAGGRVTMTALRAEHGQTVFETNGVWVPNSRGGWQLQFDHLHVDRLAADYDLKRAAPAGIGKVIEHLKPVGTFSIHDGQVRFSRDVAGSTRLISEWNISLGCQQNDLELGVPLRSVSGIVRLHGQHDGNLRFTRGQLDLDSVFWNGMQFTDVRGPLMVDTKECRLGRGATQRINEILGRQDESKRIEAGLYGGRLEMDAAVQLDARSRYVIDMRLDGCDLKRMSTDYFGGNVDLSGSLAGQATVTGMGRSLDLLEGGGRLAIRDAQMYELPIMARMLKVLRNRVPDKTAFNGVDAQFTLDGQNIRFNELNLLGDAVSLYGKGVATFDRQLDLIFHSTVGRNDFNVPLLRSMIGQASANLLLIKVTGPVENAEVIREPLPAVNEFMEQLGGEGLATPRPVRGFWNR